MLRRPGRKTVIYVALLAACGGDDPPAGQAAVGANLIVTFTDGRVDSLNWPTARWYQTDTPGSGRLIIRADGVVGNQPPSPEAHSLWELSAIFLGSRFTSVPEGLTLPIGTTNADTVTMDIMGSGGASIQQGTLRVEHLSSGLVRLYLDAERSAGPMPFHVTGTVLASPAAQ
jgi:hypothetical protein